jgi:hypothetical protein
MALMGSCLFGALPFDHPPRMPESGLLRKVQDQDGEAAPGVTGEPGD